MIEEVIIECPFCKKNVIKVIFTPSHFESHTSKTSSKSKTVFYKTKEKYEVQSPCTNCDKSVNEIQKALEQGVRNPEKDKKVLERLKEQGFDLNFETKF